MLTKEKANNVRREMFENKLSENTWHSNVRTILQVRIRTHDYGY